MYVKYTFAVHSPLLMRSCVHSGRGPALRPMASAAPVGRTWRLTWAVANLNVRHERRP